MNEVLLFLIGMLLILLIFETIRYIDFMKEIKESRMRWDKILPRIKEITEATKEK